MEYIVENTAKKTFLKIDGSFGAGLPFLKIFESKSDAQEAVETEWPTDPDLSVIVYTGFQS
jgi:hypothetical protein